MNKEKYKIAICNDIDIFVNNSLKNYNFAKKYWALGGYFLMYELEKRNFELGSKILQVPESCGHTKVGLKRKLKKR